MKTNYRKAFTELKKIGAPVHEGGWSRDEGFRISAEDNYPIVWADYYQMTDGADTGFTMGVNNKIEKILGKHGLMCEWCNPGVLDVFEK
jgi:hypothetical protein